MISASGSARGGTWDRASWTRAIRAFTTTLPRSPPASSAGPVDRGRDLLVGEGRSGPGRHGDVGQRDQHPEELVAETGHQLVALIAAQRLPRLVRRPPALPDVPVAGGQHALGRPLDSDGQLPLGEPHESHSPGRARKSADDQWGESVEVLRVVEIGESQEDGGDPSGGEVVVATPVGVCGAGVMAGSEGGRGRTSPESFHPARDIVAIGSDDRQVEHGHRHLVRVATGGGTVPAQHGQLAVESLRVGGQVAAVGVAGRDAQRAEPPRSRRR